MPVRYLGAIMTYLLPFFLPLPLQIIHDRGSYSFLVCGMIFGGLAFTFYAFLLFFHRMYPKPSAGKTAPALSFIMEGRVAYASIHNQGAALQQNARKCLFYCCFLSPLPALTCPQSPGSHSSGFACFFCWRSKGKSRNGPWVGEEL